VSWYRFHSLRDLTLGRPVLREVSTCQICTVRINGFANSSDFTSVCEWGFSRIRQTVRDRSLLDCGFASALLVTHAAVVPTPPQPISPTHLRWLILPGARRREITIHFKRRPFAIFQHAPVRKLHANQLVIQIQPAEAISFWRQDSQAGPACGIGGYGFRVYELLQKRRRIEAYKGYEVLLYDCMIGENSHSRWSSSWGLGQTQADVLLARKSYRDSTVTKKASICQRDRTRRSPTETARK
jgi:hypothetical protein